ncbi:hypothetical protein GCM10010392_55110 [Streptomyces clavifer]|nr:hypothetical protein GCM10010392_55110 [Streptomyces clavifer]
MSGTDSARDSIVHAMGFAGGSSTGGRGPAPGSGTDAAAGASCTDVMAPRSPDLMVDEHSNESTHLG